MRNVIVTGGTRGLGLGIAEALAVSGFNVVAVARREGDAFGPIRDRMPDRLRFVPFDLADLDGLGGLVKSIRAGVGPLYGLVNNAAMSSAGMLATLSAREIEQVIRLNVTSPMLLTKYVARSMMTGSGGRIVNVSSIVASTGYPGLSVYGGSKSALIGFTKSLARELGPLGITVNAVAPGFVATEMTTGLDAADRAKIARRSALGRAPEIADVAAAVDYLFSDKARNVTGTVLTIDAGNTA